MTPPGQRHIDTRPLPEKLEEHVEPVVYTIDISSGRAYKIRGTGHDIAALKKACGETLGRIEDNQLDVNAKHFVNVPKRETPH
jgi:hypothetical protein